MGSMRAAAFVPPEVYLEIERHAETKSEYVDGAIVAMTGASRAHNLIAVNVATQLHGFLRDGPCEVYVADMRVRATTRRSVAYLYPDVVVVCGEAQFEDAHGDTLLNPTLAVEILSPSTERYDRRAKFAWYRSIETLEQYVLIAQDRAHIEVYSHHADAWVYHEAHTAGASVQLPAIGCELAVDEVYRKVEIPAD